MCHVTDWLFKFWLFFFFSTYLLIPFDLYSTIKCCYAHSYNKLLKRNCSSNSLKYKILKFHKALQYVIIPKHKIYPNTKFYNFTIKSTAICYHIHNQKHCNSIMQQYHVTVSCNNIMQHYHTQLYSENNLTDFSLLKLIGFGKLIQNIYGDEFWRLRAIRPFPFEVTRQINFVFWKCFWCIHLHTATKRKKEKFEYEYNKKKIGFRKAEFSLRITSSDFGKNRSVGSLNWSWTIWTCASILE